MTSLTFFFFFIPILAFILLAVNIIFAPHNPYMEKNSAFECGFHSFTGQNRKEFSIVFFIFGIFFIAFDVEVTLVFPYALSSYTNSIFGTINMLIFLVLLTLGFVFELGKNALSIDSKQKFNDITSNRSNDSKGGIVSKFYLYIYNTFLLNEQSKQLLLKKSK